MNEEDEPLEIPGPVCWRCKDKLVIHLLAGNSAPCPACFYRANRRHLQREVMWRCRPRSHYRLPTSES